MIGFKKNSRHFLIQSEAKPKPILTRSRAFSRALRQPRIITPNFDWLIGFSVSFVIGWSDQFGFGFRTLNMKTAQLLQQINFYCLY